MEICDLHQKRLGSMDNGEGIIWIWLKMACDNYKLFNTYKYYTNIYKDAI